MSTTRDRLSAAAVRQAAVRHPAAQRLRRFSGRPRVVLYLVATAVALALLLPEAFLLLQAHDVGWAELKRVLVRPLSVELLRNTVELAVVVTVCTAIIGTAAAWCVERTRLPGKRVWAVLVVLPVSIPDFVVGYAWHSLFPTFVDLPAASVVMTLDLYPLVYLPVAAALRRTDPALEETAHSLGYGPFATFRRVVLPQIRPALFGGCLVVLLALLAEFGAFEILNFRTFTTEIFTELQVDSSAASAMSLLLVTLGIVVLIGEGLSSGRGRISRAGPQASRPPIRRRLGPWLVPTTLGLALVVVLAVGLPIGTLVYWLTHSQQTTLPASTTLLDATLVTVRYSAGAALVATIAAIPVALLAARRQGRIAMVLERSTYLIQSVPGVVIALSLVFFSVRYLFPLYQTSVLLVIAYALLFFPLALVCVRASAMQASPRLAEMGRSLGHRPISVLFRVTLPIIAPGVAAAFCLVFLSSVTELTATLVLVPTDVHTLATQFWAFQTNTAYGAAAPYAAVIVAIAAIPSIVVGTWFSRRQGGDVGVVAA
ncbi:MAG TPA: iron ABC transporter permease [Pseudonocardiaceae bacterium]|nr:iron ABC transporter permease [Pseudonocardiaceae bacterium]